MSDAVTATGILVKRNGVTIAEITDVAPGGESRNKIESSTHNAGESFVLGVLRRMDPVFKVNFLGDNATHLSIDSDIQNNTRNAWQILFPSGLQRNGDACVQSLIFDAVPVDGKQGATITLSWATGSDDVTTTTGVIVKRAGVTIAQVTDVEPGGSFRNKIETTTHNQLRESHVLGLLRQNDPGFKINFVGSDATHAQIVEDIEDNIEEEWEIAFPSGLSRAGDARVQSLNFDEAGVDTKQGATVTLVWSFLVTQTLS